MTESAATGKTTFLRLADYSNRLRAPTVCDPSLIRIYLLLTYVFLSCYSLVKKNNKKNPSLHTATQKQPLRMI